jgi:hypothetical protein
VLASGQPLRICLVAFERLHGGLHIEKITKQGVEPTACIFSPPAAAGRGEQSAFQWFRQFAQVKHGPQTEGI